MAEGGPSSSLFANLGSGFGNAAAPEANAITAVAKHAPAILMVPLLFFSVFLLLIGIIVFSADSNKIPGVMLLLLGGGVAFGAFHTMSSTEKNKTS